MTSKLTYVGAIGMTAVALIAASPAYAAGTTAGTTITNNVTVDYQVGGVAQGQQTASNSFVVDRKINLLVEEVGSVTTEVVPGQSNAVTTFQLTNTSNEVLDFALTASQVRSAASMRPIRSSPISTSLQPIRRSGCSSSPTSRPVFPPVLLRASSCARRHVKVGLRARRAPRLRRLPGPIRPPRTLSLRTSPG